MHCVWVLLSLAYISFAKKSLPVEWTARNPDHNDERGAGGYPILQRTMREVYRGDEEHGTYSNHANIENFDGKLFLSWSNGLLDKNSGGQRVLFTTSTNGKAYKEWKELFPPQDIRKTKQQTGDRFIVPVGFARVSGLTFGVAYVSDIDSGEEPQFMARTIGYDDTLGDIFWLKEGMEPKQGFPSYPSGSTEKRFYKFGRKLEAWRRHPSTQCAWGCVDRSRAVADDGRLLLENSRAYVDPEDRNTMYTLWSTPSNFEGEDKVMYVEVSRDAGDSWSKAVATDIPDIGENFFVGKLPDGRIYNINNVYSKDSLMLSTSVDGKAFSFAWTVEYGHRSTIQFPGVGKSQGWSSPSATVMGTNLVVAYSINKEGIWTSVIPLSLMIEDDSQGPRAQKVKRRDSHYGLEL